MMMPSLRVICAAIAFAASLAWAGEVECLQCPSQDDTVVFYVDVDTLVQPSNSWLYHIDRIDRPVPDIAMAKQLIEGMRSQCGKQGSALNFWIRVEIREGTYAPDTEGNSSLPKALVFDSDDGGSATHPIVYSAYSTTSGATYEPVLISGGVELTDWTTLKGPGIVPNRWWTQELPWLEPDLEYWEADVPRDLYVDNERAVRAREPDVVDSPSTDGFADVLTANYTIHDPDGMGPTADKSLNTYTIDTDYLFPPAASSPRAYHEERGTEVVMRNRGAWISHRQYVRDVVPDAVAGETSIHLHDMLGVPHMQAEYVYEADSMSCRSLTQVYLENAHEFMDEPFEWFFNPPGTAAPAHNDNFLWIILPDDRVPPGPGGPVSETANTTIIVPYARELFYLDDCSYIKFEGLNFAHTRQELPTPVPYKDDSTGGHNHVHNGSFVSVVKATPTSTTMGGTYEAAPDGKTPLYRKFQADNEMMYPGVLDRLDYPKLGWFDRGRALSFYQGHSPHTADPLVPDDDARLVHGAAIRIVNGQDCWVDRSRLAHLGGAGVIIENGSGHTVTTCEIFDTGASAVVVSRLNRASHRWFAATPPVGIVAVPDDFTIHGNYIYGIGKTFLSSPAIHLEWTARYLAGALEDDDGGFVGYNYINEPPADGIFAGNQTSDNGMIVRPQTRGVNISFNVVRNPAQLMDDMAGIVMMRDGDVSAVSQNVVYHDPPLTTTAKRGLYTDGNSEFVKDPRPTSLTGWNISQNSVWGFVLPFNMNTSVTCPEHNLWSNNYTNILSPMLKCVGCSDVPITTPCAIVSTTPGTFDCGNGYDKFVLYIPFDPGVGRTIYDANLDDPMTRSTAAAVKIDAAGPSGSTPLFLYTTYIDLIHPTNPAAIDRTPPSP